MACCLRVHPLPTQMHMDARSRKHSEITQTVYDLPPIFTCVIATENRALAPDEWDVADRATQRAAAAAAAATHPRESECTLPTTTRPASDPSSVHAPNTLPPAEPPATSATRVSSLTLPTRSPRPHPLPGSRLCLKLVEHLRDLVGDLVSNLLFVTFSLTFPPATEPSPRMKGCCRPRLTASCCCCCCCCCDSSPGVRVHAAHDNAPHVVSLHSHFPHLKPGPGVGPWVRVRSAAYRQHTHAKTHADATAEKSDEKENTDYDQTDDQLVGGRGRTRRWADRSATVRA